MTCIQLLQALIASADPQKAVRFVQPDGTRNTCDQIISGDANRTLHKVAVAMFPTVDVIRQAADFGADAILVHEPTFYDHLDLTHASRVASMKAQLLEETGLTVFRFHDHAHARLPDLIFRGEMHLLQLPGHVESYDFGFNSYVLDTPMTARELAKYMEEALHIRHIRIAGCADTPGTRICCAFGAAGSIAQKLENHDFFVTGEITEWCDGEYARDFAQFGYNKALIVLTHEASERAGMQLLTEELTEAYPDIVFRYLESGDLYTYTN